MPKDKKDKKLKVTSIFLSVNGEVGPSGQGSWTVFVRTHGCSAKCSYCDTKYSHEEGSEYEEMSAREVFAEIVKLDPGCNRVTLTGGEPLEQDAEALKDLILLLSKLGYIVTVETNGMLMSSISTFQYYMSMSALILEGKLSFVADMKLPSSGNPWNQMIYGGGPIGDVTNAVQRRNFEVHCRSYRCLGKNDFIKFVIADRKDFDIAMQSATFIKEEVTANPQMFFSPCGVAKPAELFNWMKEAGCAKLNIGYNLQIHKFIFPEDWRVEEK